MDLGLADKVALVGGGSSGLGLAVAEELAKEGAHVAIGARDPKRLAVAERHLKSIARGQVYSTSVDVLDATAVSHWVEDIAAQLGGPHVVVTNSGGPPSGLATTFALEHYKQAANAVLFPAIGLALTALPYMKKAGWGRLLFITSETVCRPIARFALSGTCRVGIVAFAQALVQDLGNCGITVNVLAPGYHRTPPVEQSAGPDVESGLLAMAEHIPLRRVGRPQELAAAAAFLASERASFITGTVQLIDGGASVVR